MIGIAFGANDKCCLYCSNSVNNNSRYFVKCEFQPIDLFLHATNSVSKLAAQQFLKLAVQPFSDLTAVFLLLWIRLACYEASWLALKWTRLWIRPYIPVFHSLRTSSCISCCFIPRCQHWWSVETGTLEST